MQHLSFGYPFLEVFLLTKPQGIGGTGINTARFLPVVIQEMGAHGTLLGYVEVGIEVDYTVGTGIETVSGAGALLRIYDDDAVLSLVDGTCLAGRDAGPRSLCHQRHGESSWRHDPP